MWCILSYMCVSWYYQTSWDKGETWVDVAKLDNPSTQQVSTHTDENGQKMVGDKPVSGLTRWVKVLKGSPDVTIYSTE